MAVKDEGQVEGLSRFFKTGPGQYGEGDRFLGIKVPVTRAVVKACWRETDWAELERCIASEYHEVRLAALLTLVEVFSKPKLCSKAMAAENYFSEGFPKNQFSAADRPRQVSQGFPKNQFSADDKLGQFSELFSKTGAAENYFSQGFAKNQFSAADNVRLKCVEFYLSHTGGINNWDLVDLSCYPLLGVWLLDKDRSLLYELARNGRTIWEQRIGMVSTMTFVRHGQLQDTFNIADILLHHPHDLIHKAVGWLLREAGKRDKPALEAYLQETPDQVGGDAHPVMPGSDRASLPRYRQMPRTMLRYAIEKFPERERQAYLRGEV